MHQMPPAAFCVDLPDAYRYLAAQSSHPSITRLILCRHGESFANQAGYVAGQTLSTRTLQIQACGMQKEYFFSDLTEKGRAQAKEVGKRLAQAGIHIDQAYTSPLPRALQTASEILNTLGIEKPPIPAIALIEKHFGRDEHVSNELYRNAYEQEKKDFKTLLSWDERFKYKTWPDDGQLESLHEVFMRACRFLSDIGQHHPGQNILVSSHKVVLKSLLMGLLKQTEGLEIGYRSFDLENGAVFVIEVSYGLQLTPKAISGWSIRQCT